MFISWSRFDVQQRSSNQRLLKLYMSVYLRSSWLIYPPSFVKPCCRVAYRTSNWYKYYNWAKRRNMNICTTWRLGFRIEPPHTFQNFLSIYTHPSICVKHDLSIFNESISYPILTNSGYWKFIYIYFLVPVLKHN